MKKIYYNKLIRDKIPERIRRSGGDYKVRTLGQKSFCRELIKKVGEEADGLLSAKNKKGLIFELADVIDVIDEMKRIEKIKDSQIRMAQKENFLKKGGFKKKIYLIWSSDTGYKTNERRYKK